MGKPTHRHAFGRCVVDVDKREVRLDGVLQVTTPKVFDLLLYLIEHRDRVVTQHELFERFWPDTYVSQNSLARAVMKARAAIGDTHAGSLFIRTAHRVGYRFVGGPAHDEAARPATEASDRPAPFAPRKDAHPPARAGRSMRLALLPFVNRTDEARLAWIDLGLMSLVRHALEVDARLSLLGVADTLGVIRTLGSAATPEAMALAMAQTLGAEAVVHCEVSRSGPGYRLDYRVFGARGRGLAGGHEDSQPARLGQWLAQSIESGLHRGEACAVPLQFADPLANEVLARAIEASEHQQSVTAARLFEVVLDIEPDHARLRLLAARCLARDHPARALAIARALLHEHSDGSEPRFLASVHEVLGRALLQGGTNEEGQAHLRQALGLVENLPLDDDVLSIHAANALAARLRGDRVTPRRLLGTVESASRALGNNIRLAWAQNNLAVMALEAGHLEEALQRIDESVVLAREHGQLGTLCSALGTCAELHGARGDLRAALSSCEEVVQALVTCQWDTVLALETLHASTAYRERCDLAGLDRLFALAQRLEGQATPRVAAPWLAAQAMRSACLLRHHEGIPLLQRALAMAEPADTPQACEILQLLMEFQLRCDLHADAEASAARADAMTPSAVPPSLRHSVVLARAALAHARHQRADALEMLMAFIADAPPGRLCGLARLDAAWLQLENGELDAAEGTLDGAEVWLRGHPLGLAVQARRQHAHGRHDAARTAHDASVGFYPGPMVPAWLLERQRWHAQTPPAAAIDGPLPRLPSLM